MNSKNLEPRFVPFQSDTPPNGGWNGNQELDHLADRRHCVFLVQHSKGNEQAEAEASKDAEKHIKTIKEAGSKGQASVVKNLLSAVFDVKPVAPAKQ